MFVREILEVDAVNTSNQKFDLKPSGVLDPKGNKIYNVVDSDGNTVKQFRGPNAAGEAEQFRDKQNKLARQQGVNVGDKKATAPDVDADKDASKTKTKAGWKKIALKLSGKTLWRIGYGGVIGAFLGALEAQKHVDMWAEHYYYNGCSTSVRSDIANSQFYFDKMQEAKQNMVSALATALGSFLGAAAAGSQLAGGTIARWGSKIPLLGLPGIFTKVLVLIAAGTLSIGVAYIAGKLAKNIQLLTGIGENLVGNFFTSSSMKSYVYFIGKSAGCNLREDSMYPVLEDKHSKKVNSELKKIFNDLKSDPKGIKAIKDVKKQPNPKALAS